MRISSGVQTCALPIYDYLERAQPGGGDPLRYPYRYLAPVNTGVPSGLDLDGIGTIGGAGRDRGTDAGGYGLHPGQHGLLVLSRYPTATDAVRPVRRLHWIGVRRPAPHLHLTPRPSP